MTCSKTEGLLAAALSLDAVDAVASFGAAVCDACLVVVAAVVLPCSLLGAGGDGAAACSDTAAVAFLGGADSLIIVEREGTEDAWKWCLAGIVVVQKQDRWSFEAIA